VNRILSAAVVLLDPDIDTDQLVPARLLLPGPGPELAWALFRDRRDSDASFPLDEPGAAGRSILVTGPNFGCGSSREAAGWALRAAGFEALVGTSFAAVFAANCAVNGIVPAVLSVPDHARLVAALEMQPAEPVELTLQPPRIVFAGLRLSYRLDPAVRAQLGGGDELAELLALLPAVDRYERGPRIHPTAVRPPTNPRRPRSPGR
jgi:3-isopropylmalate/(R)-2-methylmalate dehydratase small subunit